MVKRVAKSSLAAPKALEPENISAAAKKRSSEVSLGNGKEEWLSLITFGKTVADPQGETPYSATIELYDAIPKFFYGKQKSDTVQGASREVQFRHRDNDFCATIKGAVIKDDEGKNSIVFPGKSEELIEDVLRKLAIDGQAFVRDGQIGVRFTLYQVFKMLKETNNQRSYNQIKEALQVLADSKIELTGTVNNKTININSSLIPTLTVVTQKDTDDGEAQCTAIFHALVTESLRRNTHRLSNLQKTIKLVNSVARRLHKRITHNFSTAGGNKDIYRIKMSTILNDLNIRARRSKGETYTRTLKPGLDELKARDIITDWVREDTQDGQDYVLQLFLSKGTIQEIIKANTHRRNTLDQIETSESKLIVRGDQRPRPRPLPGRMARPSEEEETY